MLGDLAASPEERERLERRIAEPTLWDGFCTLMESNGLPMPADDEEQRTASLVAMARRASGNCSPSRRRCSTTTRASLGGVRCTS